MLNSVQVCKYNDSFNFLIIVIKKIVCHFTSVVLIIATQIIRRRAMHVLNHDSPTSKSLKLLNIQW